MTFNEFMEDGHSLKEKLYRLFEITCGQNLLRLKKVDVVQPEHTYPECMILQIPYQYTVHITCEFYSGPNQGMEFDAEFKVPKMCERGFLLRSSNGQLKWRSVINLGTIDRIIAVFSERIFMKGVGSIYLEPTFESSDKLFAPPRIVTDQYVDGKREYKIYDLHSYLEKAGYTDVDQYVKKVDPDNISSSYKDIITEYEPLNISTKTWGYGDQLPERMKNKLYELTGIDDLCSLTNPFITGQAIMELVKCYRKNFMAFEVFTPFDIRFETTQDIIFGKELENKKWKRKIANDLTITDKKPNPRLSGEFISRRIQSIFSMHDTKFNTVQTAATSNAASFLSQTNKIYFVDGNRTKKTLKYTNDFYGLICAAKTPEGVSLCNIKNELANDVILEEGEPKIRLMNKEGKIIAIPYSEYYRSRILSVDNYDYDDHKVVTDKDGMIKIFKKGVFTKVKYTGDNDWDYMRDIPESGLALNTGLIPMVNKMDGVRTSMSTNMIDQSIPIQGGRPPIVGTPIYKDIYNKSDLNYRSEVEGTVEGVIDNYIKIRKDNGSSMVITTPPSMQSTAHTFNRFRPAVKVGDRIQKGTVLMESDSFKDKSLALTTPLKVAYMMYGAKTDEDAIVISETASRKLAHVIDRDIRIDIPANRAILFNKNEIIARETQNIEAKKDQVNEEVIKSLEGLNDLGLPEVGKTYYIGDSMYFFYQEVDPESKVGSIMKLVERRTNDLTKPVNFDIIKKGLPYGLQECTVTSVKVYGRPSMKHNTEFLKVYNYYKNIDDQKKAKIREVLGDFEVPEHNIVLRDGAKSGDPAISIIITTRSMNYAKKGDKIANRFGSKGTISEVLPDMECPRVGGVNGERVDIIMPAQSTLNRKNMAQLMEVNLCEVSKIAFKQDEDNLKSDNPDFEKIRDNLNILYLTKRFSGYTDKELIDFHNSNQEFYSLNVGAMDKKYNPENLIKISKHFNYRTDGYYVYIPKLDSMTKNPVLTGTTEIMRLHFIPEWKSKATANVEFNDELVMGIGSGKSGGQRIGPMESWELIAYNTLDEFYNLSNKDKGIGNSYDDTTGEILTAMKLIGLNVEFHD